MNDQEFIARARQLQQYTPPQQAVEKPGAEFAGAALDLVASLADANCPRENEYLDEETGLLRCKVCGGPRQVVITPPFPNRPTTTVRCRCKCLTENELRQQAQDREMAQERRERRRADCFARLDAEGNLLGVSDAINWTFANDNGQRPDLIKTARKYAELFPQYLKDGNGLLFYGPVGTGKSYAAASVANAIIDQGYTARMTDFGTVRNTLFSVRDKQKYINSLCEPDLLIIDDLGAESKTEFMQETVFNVINSRYNTGKPMIITTNLTRQELSQPGEIGYQRIYDRIPERCLSVHVPGESLRTAAAIQNKHQMRKQLGMEV